MSSKVLRYSELIYDCILKFYPANYRQEFGKEMEYVFSESLKDAYAENGEQGIITLWAKTIIDAGKSIVSEHLDNQKVGVFMKTKNTDIITQNKIFFWIVLATVLTLMIPFLLIQFQVRIPDPGSTAEVLAWGLEDFIAMGILIFTFGSLFVLAARKVNKENRIVVGIALFFLFLLTWAELAVDAVSQFIAFIF